MQTILGKLEELLGHVRFTSRGNVRSDDLVEKSFSVPVVFRGDLAASAERRFIVRWG
ncbi:hypothetical protein M5C99_02485 [Acidovorax sp. NCPPB 2350]|nr:hypothetical protein M5C99_02485 [Acidovorax sp. NCPPB 2350]